MSEVTSPAAAKKEIDEDIGDDLDVLLQAVELSGEHPIRLHIHDAAQAARGIRQAGRLMDLMESRSRGTKRRIQGAGSLVKPEDLDAVLASLRG